MSDTLPDTEAVRAEVRAWLEENWNAEWRGQAQEGPDRVAWLTKVVEAGWAAVQWPKEWFGREYDDVRGRIVRAPSAPARTEPTSGSTRCWLSARMSSSGR